VGSGDVDLTGVRWSPQGQLLIAFQGGALALIDPTSGAGFTLPIAGASAYSWGPEYPPPVNGFALPQNGYFLALDNTGVMQVWRLPADSTLPVTVTPSALDISAFDIAPDGTRVAYVSNSSLWVFALGTDTPALEVVQLGISEQVAPAWGPDNVTLYYRDEQASGSGIWRVLVGEAPQLFVPDVENSIFSNPRIASGVGAMLVNRNSELMIVDTTSGEQTLLNASGEGQWITGTELLVKGDVVQDFLSGNGLFLFDANNLQSDAQLVMPTIGSLRLLDYRAQGNVIRVLIQNTTPGPIQILDVPRDGSTPTIVGTAGYLTNPSLSPDGNTIVGYTAPGGALLVYDVQTGQRIMIDTLPQVSHFVWE
jgi:WD40 repeat protein